MKLKLITICVAIMAALAFSVNTSAQVGQVQSDWLKAFHECYQPLAQECKTNADKKVCMDDAAKLCAGANVAGSNTDPQPFCVQNEMQVCISECVESACLIQGLKIYNTEISSNMLIGQRFVAIDETTGEWTIQNEIFNDVSIADAPISYVVRVKEGFKLVAIINEEPVEVQPHQDALENILTALGWSYVLGQDGRPDFYAMLKDVFIKPQGELRLTLAQSLSFATAISELVFIGINEGVIVEQDGSQADFNTFMLLAHKYLMTIFDAKPDDTVQHMCLCITKYDENGVLQIYKGGGPYGPYPFPCDFSVPGDYPETPNVTELGAWMEWCGEAPPICVAECMVGDKCNWDCDACVQQAGCTYDWNTLKCNCGSACDSFACFDANDVKLLLCPAGDDICEQQCIGLGAVCREDSPYGCTPATKHMLPLCSAATQCDHITCLCDGNVVEPCNANVMCSGILCVSAWSPGDCDPEGETGIPICPAPK